MASFAYHELKNNFLDGDIFYPDVSFFGIQKDSYSSFLYSNNGKKSLFQLAIEANFPIHDSYGHASLEFVSYRVGEPKYTPLECIEKSITYGVTIYATFRFLVYSVVEGQERVLRSVVEQEVLLMTIPLITDDGTFIVNGVQRVIVSQIHKSPGVFFSREKVEQNFLYFANIIPYNGRWIEFSFDQKDELYFRIDKKKKLPINHIFRALDYERSDIAKFFYKDVECIRYNDSLFEIKFDLKTALNGLMFINLRNEKGEILIMRNKNINKKDLQALGDTKLFVSKEDLIDSEVNLFEAIQPDDTLLFDVFSKIESDFFSILEKKKINSFKILNKSANDFSEAIVHSVLANHDLSKMDCLHIVNNAISPNEIFNAEKAKETFNKKFFNKENYDFFDVGRYKVNATLGINFTDTTCLTPEDVMYTVKKLIALKVQESQVDDIDSLANRRVRSVGELLYGQFALGLNRVTKVAVEKLNTLIIDTAKPSDLIVGSHLNKIVKDFFMSSQFSQFLEQTNILSEISHKRKISSLGIGGIKKEHAGLEVRDIHDTQYGKICPIETPDGQGVGLIMNLASYSSINEYGFIETPYRKVVNGKITNEVEYLDYNKESQSYISISSEVENPKRKMKSCRYNNQFTLVNSEDVQYVEMSSSQLISVVASLIPFIENNDGTRALMGCSMQKQSIPLLKTECPVVSTGIERFAIKGSCVVTEVKRTGVVEYVDSDLAIIKTDDESFDMYKFRKFEKTNQNTSILQVPNVRIGDRVEQGKIITEGFAIKNDEVSIGKNALVAFMPWRGYNYEDSIVVSNRILKEDTFTSVQIESFECKIMDTKKGQEEFTKDLPIDDLEKVRYLDDSAIVYVGTKVKPGDILVGRVTPKGESAIPPEERLLRAIFGEKLSEVRDSSLVVPNSLKSGTVIATTLLTRRGMVKKGRAIEIEREKLQQRKFEYDLCCKTLEKIFAEKFKKTIGDADVLYKKESKKLLSSLSAKIILDSRNEMTIKDSKLAGKFNSILAEYKENMEKLFNDYDADVQKIMDGEDLPNGVLAIAKVYVATKSKIQPGDKMSGRHGNKGVVSIVAPEEDMPYMSNGRPVDIVLSPLGIPGRMNIGQVLETHLGLVSYGIGDGVDRMIKNRESAENIKKFLFNVLTDKKLKQKLDGLSTEEFMSVVENYRNGMPFECPVFNSPSSELIADMAEKLGFDRSCQVDLYDGITGEKFDRKVTVGYKYMMKLHHLVDDKVHARSVGNYSLITQQPLGGRAQNGGQRLGEMEVWALSAYGATYNLQEMLTVKSDDIVGRSAVYDSIVNNQPKFKCGFPESMNVLMKELLGLGFDVSLIKKEDLQNQPKEVDLITDED